MLLVERHLAYTVDGIVGVVHNLRHTVLSTLHHHAASKHSAEVGALDGVHQASGIARAHTVFFPECCIWRTVGIEHGGPAGAGLRSGGKVFGLV